jgi:hypothetical protein
VTNWPWTTCNPSSSIGLNDLNRSVNMRENTTQTNIKGLSPSLWHDEIEESREFFTLYSWIKIASDPLECIFALGLILTKKNQDMSSEKSGDINRTKSLHRLDIISNVNMAPSLLVLLSMDSPSFSSHPWSA